MGGNLLQLVKEKKERQARIAELEAELESQSTTGPNQSGFSKSGKDLDEDEEN